MHSDKNLRNEMIFDNLFNFDYDIQTTLFIITPVLMAVFLFRFLHVKQATDLMHSLPLKREKIFHHFALIGVFLLVLPVVLIAIIVMITHAGLDLQPYFGLKDVLYWAGVTILLNVLLFTAGMFVAMLTGISAVQAVLTYIFLLFPIGIAVMVFSNLNYFVYGFPGEYYLSLISNELSPLTYVIELQTKTLEWKTANVYIVLTVVLYGLSLLLYKKRKLESVSEAISFPKLRPIFKYGVTFCMMLFGGMYFRQVQGTSDSWMIFGYVLGTLIGYFIAEMLLQKTWRVFARVKGLAIYIVVIAILFTGVQSFGFYEKTIPDFSEIQSVLLSDNRINYYPETDFVPSPMKGQKNIEEVRKLHHQLISDKNINQEIDNNQYEFAFISYNLKNGKKITREYKIEKDIYEDYYQKVYETKEFKQTSLELFQNDLEKANKMIVHSNLPDGNSFTISNKKDMKEAIQAVRKDVIEESYKDSRYFADIGSIEFPTGRDDGYTYSTGYKPYYRHFTKWLESKGLLKQIIVEAEDIDQILVSKNSFSELMGSQEIVRKIEKSSNTLKVIKKEEINLLIHNTGWNHENKYVAAFYYKNSIYPEVYYFDEEHAPSFIKEHLK